MEETSINITELILNTINEIFSKLFSSIDNTIYTTLDDLAFITPEIIQKSSLEKIIGESNYTGILLICNSLVLGFIIYYSINYLISHLTYSKIDSPKQFIFKSIIFIAVMNSSIWICEEIINLVSLVTNAISYISEDLFGLSISFSNFVENLNKIIYLKNSTFDFFSFDGIIKSFISFGMINLILTFSLRYIIIQTFILISPFAFLTLILNSSEHFFKIWIKAFLNLLLTQIFVSFILLLSFSFNLAFSDSITEFLYIGIIFALSKSNNYMKELFGGISTSVHMNFSSFNK